MLRQQCAVSCRCQANSVSSTYATTVSCCFQSLAGIQIERTRCITFAAYAVFGILQFCVKIVNKFVSFSRVIPLLLSDRSTTLIGNRAQCRTALNNRMQQQQKFEYIEIVLFFCIFFKRSAKRFEVQLLLFFSLHFSRPAREELAYMSILCARVRVFKCVVHTYCV